MKYIKYKYIVILLIIAVLIWVYASLQKILHAPNADLLFKVSFFVVFVCGLLAILKVILDKNDKFLNK